MRDSEKTKLYALTDKQIDALLQAANSMLAGEEGEGDAQGISFEDLENATNALHHPVTRRVYSSKRERQDREAAALKDSQ